MVLLTFSFEFICPDSELNFITVYYVQIKVQFWYSFQTLIDVTNYHVL